MSELTKNEMDEYNFIIEKYRNIFRDIYGKYPIVFEHGSPVSDNSIRANSVIHAHSHIVNHAYLDEPKIIKRLNFKPIQRIEDIKAAMLSIQGVVTNINNKHTVDEQTNALIGSKLDLENNTTGYNITEELKNSLLSVENTNLYILSQEELNTHGIKDITINNNEFYVVDYNSGEIFYSLGINGKYKLSEM